MRNALACAVLALVFLAWSVLCAAQPQRELTMWQLPETGTLPAGVVWTPGTAYVTLFLTDTLAMLDLTTDTISGIAIGDGPNALTEKDGYIYVTLALGDALVVYKPTKSAMYSYAIPTTGGWPNQLSSALPNPTSAHFAIAQRTSGILSYFQMDSTQIPDLPVTAPPFSLQLTKTTSQVQARVVPVQPYTVYVYPPGAVAQSQTPLPPYLQPPFTEWQVTTGGAYLEDVSVAASGTFWMTRGDNTLIAFDPSTSIASGYLLTAGISAMFVDAASPAGVFFIDWTANAIVQFDTVYGNETSWSIPGAIMPVGITVDAAGSVWFIDRGADMLGYLDRSTNNFYLYDVPAGSSPGGLALGQGGTDMWFVAEHGDYIGKLGSPTIP